MPVVTVAGPFAEAEARSTAAALGEKNHSAFSRYKTDADGFLTDEKEWFVERDESVVPDSIFGYDWKLIERKQQRLG